MRLKGIFTVAGIGFSERELQLFKSIFFIARNRTRVYTLIDPAGREDVDILLVNGDDPNALAEWDSYHARKPALPTVMVLNSALSAALPYTVERPVRASRVLSVLDQVSIRELAFVPELTIGQAGEPPGNLEAIAAHATRPAADCPYTALVVEDSLAVRTLIELELRMLGIRAELAESGTQALKLLHRNTYDIVFLDILLPDLDGYQICRTIKKDWTKKATPVILLTGRTSTFDRLRGKLAGCDSYLSKPVDPLTFKKTVGQYLWRVGGRHSRSGGAYRAPAGSAPDLRKGLAQGEFLLHYQPVIETATDSLRGFEALVRWRQPQRGVVPPKEFIPLAEKTGAIVPLGWWTLKEACSYIKALQACHPGAQSLFIHVNLAPGHFARPDLVSGITDILEVTGLDAASLKLDLSEETFKETSADTLLKLRQLNERGIRCHIDGFGGNTHPNLDYLQQFPAAALKLDRQLISHLPASRKHAATVEKTVALAHRLGMEVIAVGVELKEQLAYLKALPCDYVQGFWFAQPVDGNRAIALASHAAQHRVDTLLDKFSSASAISYLFEAPP